MSTYIEVNNLTKAFRGRTVVNGLSFRVQTGEVVSMGNQRGSNTDSLFCVVYCKELLKFKKINKI